MCHHLPVNLSADDRKSARRLTKVLIPAYAAVAVALIAALAVVHPPRSDEVVVSAAQPAVPRQ